jgi:tryprostatin B 6-hydroxylase
MDSIKHISTAYAFTLGILVLIFSFQVSEHHLYPTQYIYTYEGLSLGTAAFPYDAANLPVIPAYTESLYLILNHPIGLYSSLVLYRLLLHPLRPVPRPLLSRLSWLWIRTQLCHNPLFREVAGLH